MRAHRSISTLVIQILVAVASLALAQGPPPAPLTLNIAFTGQSSGDPTKPNIPNS